MIKYTITALAAAAIVTLSGCGEDRSHPNDGNGKSITYALPTAIIDLNSTDHTYSNVTKAYTVGTGTRTLLASPFIFDGSSSHDNDEGNTSIVNYAWAINYTHNQACVDINTTGSKAVFKFINTTDVNTTCQQAAITPGEINATLTVTDDEGKTASAVKNIKTN